MNKYSKLKLNRLYEAFFNNIIEILHPDAYEPQDKAFQAENWISEHLQPSNAALSISHADFEQITGKVKAYTEESRQDKERIRQLELYITKLESYVDELQAADQSSVEQQLRLDLQNANLQFMQLQEENAYLKAESAQVKDQVAAMQNLINQQKADQKQGVQVVRNDYQIGLDALAECYKLLEIHETDYNEAALEVYRFVEAQLKLRESGIFITFADYDELNRIGDEYSALKQQINLALNYSDLEESVQLDVGQLQGLVAQLRKEARYLSEKLQHMDEENMALKARVSEVQELNARYEYYLNRKGVFRKENTRQIELETRLRQQQILIYQLQDKLRTERGSRVSQYSQNAPELLNAIENTDNKNVYAEIERLKDNLRKTSDTLLQTSEELKLANKRVEEQDITIQTFSAQILDMRTQIAYQKYPEHSIDKLILQSSDEESYGEEAAYARYYNQRLSSELVATRRELEDALFESANLRGQLQSVTEQFYSYSELAYKELDDAKMGIKTLQQQIEAYKLYSEEAAATTAQRYETQIAELYEAINKYSGKGTYKALCSPRNSYQPDTYAFLLKQMQEYLTQENYAQQKEIKKLRDKLYKLHSIEAYNEEAVEKLKHYADIQYEVEACRASLAAKTLYVDEFYAANQQLCKQLEELTQRNQRIYAEADKLSRQLAENYFGATGNEADVYEQDTHSQTKQISQLKDQIVAIDLLNQYLVKQQYYAEIDHCYGIKALNAQIYQLRDELTLKSAQVQQLATTYTTLSHNSVVIQNRNPRSHYGEFFVFAENLGEELIRLKAGLNVLRMRYAKVYASMCAMLYDAADRVNSEIHSAFGRAQARSYGVESLLTSKMASELYDYRLQNYLLTLALEGNSQTEIALLRDKISILYEQAAKQLRSEYKLYKRVLVQSRVIYTIRNTLRALPTILDALRFCRNEVDAAYASTYRAIDRACNVLGGFACVGVDMASQTLMFYTLVDNATQVFAGSYHVYVYDLEKALVDVKNCVAVAKNAFLHGILFEYLEYGILRFVSAFYSCYYYRSVELKRSTTLMEYNTSLYSQIAGSCAQTEHSLLELTRKQANIISYVISSENALRGLLFKYEDVCAQVRLCYAQQNYELDWNKLYTQLRTGVGALRSDLRAVKTVVLHYKYWIMSIHEPDVHSIVRLVATIVAKHAQLQYENTILNSEADQRAERIQELSGHVLDQNYRYNALKGVYSATKTQLELAYRVCANTQHTSDAELSFYDLRTAAPHLSVSRSASTGASRVKELKKSEYYLTKSLVSRQLVQYPYIEQKIDLTAVNGNKCSSDTVVSIICALFTEQLSGQLLKLYRRGLGSLARQVALAHKKVALCCDIQIESGLRARMSYELFELLRCLAAGCVTHRE